MSHLQTFTWAAWWSRPHVEQELWKLSMFPSDTQKQKAKRANTNSSHKDLLSSRRTLRKRRNFKTQFYFYCKSYHPPKSTTKTELFDNAIQTEKKIRPQVCDFETEAFRKRWHHDKNILLTEFSSTAFSNSYA